MDKIDIDNFQDADEPELRAYSVSPNPSQGVFNVHIELKTISPVDLYLLNTNDGSIVQKISLSGEKIYDKLINLPLTEGAYILNLVTPKTKDAKKIIIY